jgi:hypothetical protein
VSSNKGCKGTPTITQKSGVGSSNKFFVCGWPPKSGVKKMRGGGVKEKQMT